MAHLLYPHPLRPEGDLRTQLTDSVFGRCVEGLEEADRVRERAFSDGTWREYLGEVRSNIIRAFGPMPFGANGGPLELQPVSRHTTRHCHVENVLFDSFPGWQVNASVFVPLTPGPHPAVVIGVGHSGKQFENYQIPAQAYAECGFVAVLFDPPGQASEKQPGNDHFDDGVRSTLVGQTANRYFVLDALRCIDYLETRDDVDMSGGVGMTGVSGGGGTSLYAAVFDDRIACFGPSCCLNRMADHPMGDAYSNCPEAFWQARIAQHIDTPDVALAALPKPMLHMAGIHDEVFTAQGSRSLAGLFEECYAAAGEPEAYRYFEDQSGHAYTLAQVEQFVGWMNRWVLREPDRAVPELDRGDYEMLDYDMLKCRPAAEENMFTLNRAIGRELLRVRRPVTAETLGNAVRGLVGDAGVPCEWRAGEKQQVWMQEYQEVLCTAEGMEMPATLLTPIDEIPPAGVVVYLDEGGRRNALEAGGVAQRMSNMFERDASTTHPVILVPDLPGWGETVPSVVPYAIAPWGSMDRGLSYASFALGDGILGIKVRCAVAVIRALMQETREDPARLVMVGRGLGGVVALLAAACLKTPDMDTPCTVMTWESLFSFQGLLEESRYDWAKEAFLPGALEVLDLPEVMVALAGGGYEVCVAGPLDGARREIDEEGARALLIGGEDVEVLAPASIDRVVERSVAGAAG